VSSLNFSNEGFSWIKFPDIYEPSESDEKFTKLLDFSDLIFFSGETFDFLNFISVLLCSKFELEYSLWRFILFSLLS